MKGGKQPRGYTIVEVMIFLVISGLMFVIAASFINGRQSRVEFKQAMNAINTDIKATIDDVTNGTYPSTAAYSCYANPSGGDLQFGGPNQYCVYMGKVMQFMVHGSSGNGYNIYTVAGRQYIGTGDTPGECGDGTPTAPIGINTIVTCFEAAKPMAITQYAPGSPSDQTHVKTLNFGLSVSKMFKLTSASPVPISAIGIFSSFGAYDTSGTSPTLEAGSQIAIITDVPNPPLNGNQTEQTAHNAIHDINRSNFLSDPNILICFIGGDGELGSINLGGSGSQGLITTLKMGGQVPGECSS